jgi:hypothetical protein
MQPKQSNTLVSAVQRILTELIDGAADNSGFVLNPKDPGLRKSLARLSAEEASATPPQGGASIAAHVDHLRYGLDLLRRWTEGEDPFGSADYTKSWQRVRVSEEEWSKLQEDLRDAVAGWKEGMARRSAATEEEIDGIVASAAHLAYHFGAIRQINRSMRGPAADE